MPDNPSRKTQGGDVEGTKRTDVVYGEPVTVAAASYDPGYDLGASLGFESKADLLQGFCSYGRELGEPEDAFEDWGSHYKKGK
jgi:hypothetical protein